MNYPDYGHQNPTDRLNHVVYLDFGMMCQVGFPEVQDVVAVWQKVAELLDPTGMLVTLAPPLKKRPGEYTTVRFVPGDAVGFSPEGSAGTVTRKCCYNPTWWCANEAWVAWRPSYTPDVRTEYIGAAAAHETVHVVQGDLVSHEEEPVGGKPNLMRAKGYLSGAVLSPGMAKEVRRAVGEFNAGWRFLPAGKVNIGK